MGKLGRLYTDDRTGKFSSTALRTWLLFFLFFLYTFSVAIVTVLGLLGCVIIIDRDLRQSLDLIWILGALTFGQGGLYLGKRFSERNSYLGANSGNGLSERSRSSVIPDRGAASPIDPDNDIDPAGSRDTRSRDR